MSKRNGHRRRAQLALAAALVAIGLAALPSPAAADQGEYRLVQCHYYWNDAPEIPAAFGDASNYYGLDACNYGDPDRRLSITPIGPVGGGNYLQFTLTAAPGTRLAYACFDYNMRRANNSRPEVLAFPGFQLLAAGGDGPTGWVNSQCFDLEHDQLIFRMVCNGVGGCAYSDQARMLVRNIDVVVSDRVNPLISDFSGPLSQPGTWLRGVQTVDVAGYDPAGAGISVLALGVNGQEVQRRGTENCPRTGGLGFNFVPYFNPCGVGAGDGYEFTSTLNTASGPFVNGKDNTVNVVALDYPGNVVGDARGNIWIDNAQPVVPGFANAQDPSDPEVIRAPVSDAHSGLAATKIVYRAAGTTGEWIPLATKVSGGEASARVDPNTPAGEYEFRLEVSDVAGNAVVTTQRQNGEPMKLTLPLRERVEIVTSLGPGGATGQTVPYGTKSEVQGRLLDSSGQPIIGKEVVVVDKFDNGALFPRAERPTVTDENGRFKTPVPAGPTRSIEAHFAGTPQYLPRDDEVGKFAVKSAAKFKTSRKTIPEGEILVFKGKLRHGGARIPAGGKLVAIQYRLKTGRQRTLKDAFRTKENGRFKLRYRFSKALSHDALFRFRTKIINEANWPYKGAVTKWRKVIVRAN